jgi:SAM-dependent MidA family methyltransferase
VLRRLQEHTLQGLDVPLAWHRDAAEVPAGPAIFLANEFFDALPVQQAVKAPDGWHERMVGADRDRLVFALNPAPARGLDNLLPPSIRGAPAGAVFEWRSDAIVRELAGRVAREGGAALVIDYGHVASAVGETLQAVAAHRFVHPLAAPGESDLTAHVDFAALGRAAASAGARPHGPVTQGAFLHGLGIEARARRLKQRATPAQAAEVDVALARLTGSGQDQMGELFKAMAFADPQLSALPGFDN